MANPKHSSSSRQLRFFVKHSGRSTAEVRRIFHQAGIKDVDGSDKLTQASRIDVKEALAAMGKAGSKQQEAPPAPTPPPAKPDLSALDAASAQAVATVPAARPLGGPGSGGEDDPVSDALVSGEIAEEVKAFPMPTHPDPDKVYWPVNINPNRQTAMLLRGWRFITTQRTKNRIRPDGLYNRMLNAVNNRIRYKDLELAFIPRVLYERRRAARHAEWEELRQSNDETLRANIEDQKRLMRDKLGEGKDRHIEVYEATVDEADDRGKHAVARAAGAPTKTQVDLGSSTSR